MKEYFSHDYHARTDRKMINLQMKHGMAGVGIYWCLIEIAYENNGVIPISDCERITFELRTKYERIKSVLEDFDLFYTEDGFYHSVSIDRRLLERKEKSESARKSVNKRWEKTKDQDINTNVLRTYDERNTIKEKNIKEKNIKKKKEISKEKKFDFKKSILGLGVEEAIATDWLAVRDKKRASNTETAFKAIKTQIKQSGLPANECIKSQPKGAGKDSRPNGSTKNRQPSISPMPKWLKW